MSAPRVVMTSGVFDLLHRGHLNLLWRAKALGDFLVVGVVSDAGAAAYKGQVPIENVQQRIRNVERVRCVDAVALQSGTDPSELLERFRPDILCHGDDWTRLRAGQETVERLGIEWVLLPYTPGVSTTLLRANGQSQPQELREVLERL